MKCAAIILAAGASTRLGQPKQLLLFRGQTLLQCALDAATGAGCSSITIVLGAHAAEIKKSLPTGAIAVENPHWQEGMGSSIRAGLQSLPPETEAVLILLCDQPLVTSETLRALLAQSKTGLAATEYSGSLGVPALFIRAYFPELLTLAGKQGAKAVLMRHQEKVARIPFPEGAIDIDTEEDFTRLARI